MQTGTPKDRPHLNKLDFFKYFNVEGVQIVHWDTLTPYPHSGEEEHRIIVKKTGSLNFADDFPLLAERVENDETWQEVLEKRFQA